MSKNEKSEIENAIFIPITNRIEAWNVLTPNICAKHVKYRKYIYSAVYERESEQNCGQTLGFRFMFQQRITGTLKLLLGDTKIDLKIEKLSVIPPEMMGLLMM